MIEHALPRTRLDSLTSLRWFAAFAVFGHHFLNFATVPQPLSGLMGFGHLGVPFFFVLSGFVLTWSWRASVDTRTFYWRRFARIWPLHMVTLLIAIPVFYRVVAPPDAPWIKPLDVGILLLSVVLLQGWSRDPVILFSGNPAAWTLTVEAFFYALHPFITMPLRRLGRRGALIAAGVVIAAALGLRIATIPWPGGWTGAIPWPVLHLYEFVLGMCLAWAIRAGWRVRIPLLVPALAMLAWFVFLLVGAAVPSLTPTKTAMSPFTLEVVTILFATMIASAATHDIDGKRSWLRWRPLVALGEWSFAFYLIHATIIYALLELLGHQNAGMPRTAVWLVVLLGASILAAWTLHRFIERPLERRLRAWQDTRRQARAERVDATANA